LFDPRIGPSDYRFERLDIWVRILNLPFGLMNDKRGKGLAGRVGEVGRMDVDVQGRAWGDYLCFRASIKITEPLMRCVSVFSQKWQQLEQLYTVMYERLPTVCFSCGLLGHSSTASPTPAERDADGFLPYHGPRLCVPNDRKKKQSGTSSSHGTFASDRGSRQSQGRGGPRVQSQGTSVQNQKEKETSGGVTSPENPKQTRQRRTRGAAKNAPANAAELVKGDKQLRTVGVKRKEYRPKVPVQQSSDFLPSTVVSEGALVLSTTTTRATDDSGNDQVADSDSSANKKLKTGVQVISPRSADLAATAEQSRQTQ
jgi:hypothetical protein